MRLAFVVLLAGLVGCGPSYKTTLGPIVESECIACHVGEADNGGGFDISGGWDAIVEVEARQTSEMPLITPGDHLQSYLWHKLNGSQSLAAGAGTQMPLGGSLSDEEIAEIASWIDAGARK